MIVQSINETMQIPISLSPSAQGRQSSNHLFYLVNSPKPNDIPVTKKTKYKVKCSPTFAAVNQVSLLISSSMNRLTVLAFAGSVTVNKGSSLNFRQNFLRNTGFLPNASLPFFHTFSFHTLYESFARNPRVS